MAAGHTPTPSTRQAFHHPVPVPTQNVATPPSKRDLTSWWKNFKKNAKKEEEKAEALEPPSGIFGVPLQESIKYANVAISLTNEQGESYIYGYVPIVVAKCGVFLKEKATDVEGIFRLSGSAKRIKELQAAFDSPDRYGKGLDWTGFTVHDAANILRRYLNNLPQPIVPLEFYEKFRDPLRSHQAQALGDVESHVQEADKFDHGQAIITYQKLITELPPLNRQLLLYILDLLAVFASKSDLNRMGSANLAAIFQPGLLTHPTHDMEPKEYRLSQDVLIFLIENQDSFLVGMSGTASDEKTVKELQSSTQTRRPNSPRTPQSAVARSSSNASAGADSLRKFGGIRRNVSVSSKNSKNSATAPSPIGSIPGSPHTPGSGMHRSNTVPSKKSPGIPSRLSRPMDQPIPTGNSNVSSGYLSPAALATSPAVKSGVGIEGRSSSTASSLTPTNENPVGLAIANGMKEQSQGREDMLQTDNLTLQPPTSNFGKSESSGTPTRERKLSGLFAKSPTSDSERKDTRQPNKLRKKRMPESSNASAQSSTHSLHATPDSPAGQAFYTPMPTPGANNQVQVDPMASATNQPPPLLSNTSATPTSEVPPQSTQRGQESQNLSSQLQSPPLKAARSPTPSIHSRTSATDVTSQSEADQAEEPGSKEERKGRKHRWRFSSSGRRNGDHQAGIPNLPNISSDPIAEQSTSSLPSQKKPSISATPANNEARDANAKSPTELSMPANAPPTSPETTPSKDKDVLKDRDTGQEPAEKRGPIGWFKEKVAKAKEERKEREAEKERNKSPPRSGSEAHSGSKQSLSAIANEGPARRGRSLDTKGEEVGSSERNGPVPGHAGS